MGFLKHFGLINKVLNFSAERYFKTAGDLFIYEGDYETALDMVNKTLELEPGNVRALVLKGDILFCMNRDLDALKVLNDAIEQDDSCAEAYISKAGVLDILGKHREALAHCTRALNLVGKHNEYLLPTLFDQKIILLLRLKKYRRAQLLLSQAAERLHVEEYQYLCACYRSIIDRLCRQRGTVRERASELSLRVIEGQVAAAP